tara:strand:+ start:4017 stop:4415 length:399 start_codon:yes stop_codon:yes gene_type:complete
MANIVKTRYKSYLPGSGRNAAGEPKQGKVRVVGEIDVTSYDATNGEALTAIQLGLTTIDAINLRVSDESTNIASAIDLTNTKKAVYVKTDSKFVLLDVGNTGTPALYTEADTETLEFDAFGDSADDVELLAE